MTTQNSKPFCTHHCLPNLHTYKYLCAHMEYHIPSLIYHCLTNLHTYKYACAHMEYHIPSLIYQPCRFILHMSTSDVRLEKTNEKHEVNYAKQSLAITSVRATNLHFAFKQPCDCALQQQQEIKMELHQSMSVAQCWAKPYLHHSPLHLALNVVQQLFIHSREG